MSDVGWIKAHRQMLEHPLLQRGDALGLWTRLLLLAAHRPTQTHFRSQSVTLARGQCAVVLSDLAERMGITRQRMRTIVNAWRDDGMLKVNQAQGKAFSVVTICNFDIYQALAEVSPEAEQPRKNQAATKQQPTEQDGEEGKKEGSDPSDRAAKPPPDDAKTHLWEEMKGWLGGKRPGALIGKWCKEYTEGEVFNAYFKARVENPADRISWMIADLKQRAAQRVGAPAKTRSSLLGAVRILQENGALDDDPVGPEGSDPDGIDAAQGRNALVLLN